MNKYLSIFLFYSFFVLSGAFINLIKDGGARDEGPLNVIDYDGFLNYLLPIWKIVCVAYIISYYKLIKNKFHIYEVALLVFIFLGSFWANYPYEVLSQLFSLFLLISFSKIYAIFESRDKYIEVILRYYLIIVSGSYLMIFLLPSYGVAVGIHQGKWQGVFEHKNSLGSICGILIIFLYHEWINKKNIIYLSYLFLGAILLLKTESFTGIATGCFGIFSYNLIKKFNKNYKYISIVFICSLIILVMGINDISFGPENKDFGFSGRNVIWKEIYYRGLEKFMFGHGFNQLFSDMTGYSEEYESAMGFLVSSSHNGFLDIFYSFGFVGGLLVLIYFYKKIKSFSGSNLACLYISVASSLIILNTFESRALGYNFFYFLFLVISEFGDRSSE